MIETDHIYNRMIHGAQNSDVKTLAMANRGKVAKTSHHPVEGFATLREGRYKLSDGRAIRVLPRKGGGQ